MTFRNNDIALIRKHLLLQGSRADNPISDDHSLTDIQNKATKHFRSTLSDLLTHRLLTLSLNNLCDTVLKTSGREYTTTLSSQRNETLSFAIFI